MKKILILLISLTFLFATSACGNTDYDVKETVIEDNIIFKLDTKLSENNIEYDKIKAVSNDQNADECYYYYFDNDNPLIIFFYKDENNSAYIDAITNGFIKIDEANKVNVKTHKGLVVEVNETISNYYQIISLIESL